MDGNIVGLAAVVMIFGIPMAAMYTFFRVRKLRSEERLAAIARGMEVPMQAELSEGARSRRSGILLVAGAIVTHRAAVLPRKHWSTRLFHASRSGS